MATDTGTSARPATSHGRLGYPDYCRIPADGRRHEIIDGEHVVTPAPSTLHQTVSKRLLHELYTQLELTGNAVVLTAPVDVQLSPHDIVQPDLVFIVKEREGIITKAKIAGVPDMIIEILSPANRAYDTQVKLRTYERTGVGEYWMADPEAKTLLRHRLIDGAYRQEPPADPVTAFNGSLSVRLADIW